MYNPSQTYTRNIECIMKKVMHILPIILCILCIACKETTSKVIEKKESTRATALDSMDLAHSKSVWRAGDNITNAYVYDSLLYLDANIKKDHRIYGYAQPDTLSKRLFLLSVFTNDVQNNPFNLDLGAYYELEENTQLRIKYQNHNEHFVETIATDSLGEKTTLYFEKKWVDLEDQNNSLDDELREFGRIEKVEDGSYPFFIVTAKFISSKANVHFNLNIEAIPMNIEELNSLVGDYATIYYTSTLENNLQDLHVSGTSLFGTHTPAYDENWLQITGVLQGAATITSGDIPSTISIVSEDGTTLNFKLFIDEDTVKANGKTVNAFYNINAVNTITNIVPVAK
ncbi:hypothetical protein GCM10011344_09300 [Dokdonia pacifica]|uniref:Uncharacterized protein n=2 Tax=Dokdonia pacifica TaxID=1627892 RepID=A0A238YPR1_9FLAO|nr:hypothetical protein GCM10011344_09300 [Dokdonia pacifica]SNR73256.1 hypothetical protein SAMN06265376_102268 [Dokdonia pacifica]